MNELIIRLRKCAGELSRIADLLAAKQYRPHGGGNAQNRELDSLAAKISEMLGIFNIGGEVVKMSHGPTVNKAYLRLSPGTRYSSVTAIADNIMGAMHCHSLRIEAPVPGADLVGFECEREDPEQVTFSTTVIPEIARLDTLRRRPEVPVVVGMDVDSNVVSFDLATMPHLLTGGATGQGKSMFLHSMINGIISSRSPAEVRFVLFDPKQVEFSQYALLPHLLMPVINEGGKLIHALHWAVAEMERRLKIFALARVRNIHDYNVRDAANEDPKAEFPQALPYVVIVIDEIAELMCGGGKKIVPDISRLTAKARAAGIHLVIATRCPNASVITGTLKANIPGRIAFKTAGRLDSMTVLDEPGAENLIGRGDCLYLDKDGVLRRVQTPSITDAEIETGVAKAVARYPAEEYAIKVPKVVR